MAIKDKLNTAWGTNLTVDAIFEVRALMQSAYWDLQRAMTGIDRIVSQASFAGVETEIKAEGTAIRNILNQAKTALDGHKDFLEWSQPS